MDNFITPTRIALAAGGILALFLLFGIFHAVPAGHVGVVSTFGAVHEEPRAEGLTFKRPILDDVINVNVKLQTEEVANTAASKDLQTVRTEVSLQYSLISGLVPDVFQKIGRRPQINATVISPAIQESVKSVTARFTAEELITQRAQVKTEIEEEIVNFINNTLEDKEVLGALQIANVAVTDFQFSAEFNASIEAKVKAEQDALRAENEKLRRITEAEAAAAEITLAADAEAYQIEAVSRANADAIRREARALAENPRLVELREAEKWDGKLPTVAGGESLPILNLGE